MFSLSSLFCWLPRRRHREDFPQNGRRHKRRHLLRGKGSNLGALRRPQGRPQGRLAAAAVAVAGAYAASRRRRTQLLRLRLAVPAMFSLSWPPAAPLRVTASDAGSAASHQGISPLSDGRTSMALSEFGARRVRRPAACPPTASCSS